MPLSADLPPGLQPLARRQAIELSPYRFDTTALIRVLVSTFSGPVALVPSASPDLRHRPVPAGPTEDATWRQYPRNTARWTADEVIAAVASSTNDGAERGRSAVRRLQEGMLELNSCARRLAGHELGSWIPFEKTNEIDMIFSAEELLIPVRSQYEFEAVLLRLHKVIVVRGPGRRKAKGAIRPPVLHEMYECFREFVVRLNPLRQVYAHDKSSGSADDQRYLAACVRTLKYYLHVIKIEYDDAARWSELRLLLLEDAANSTDRALAVAGRQAE